MDMKTGLLFVGDKIIGEIGELSGIKIEEDEVEEASSINMTGECSGTIDISCTWDRLTLLSFLYGKPITNNWLKMHGGVMCRRKRSV